MQHIASPHPRTSATRTGLGVLALGAATLLGGCDALGLDDDVCTLIGCYSGLTVALQSRPTTPFRVEVRTPGAAAAYVYDCPDPARCTGTVFFDHYMPEVATVTVTTERGTVRQEVRPTYATSRPNGDDCPPICRQGTVTVPIPA